MIEPAQLRGLWSRSLLAWPDGGQDLTTQVGWLQGLSLFADLRQAPGIQCTASCLDELTAADCLMLAGQQGFAGRLEARGGVQEDGGQEDGDQEDGDQEDGDQEDGAHEWVRRIDFQPKQSRRDIGRLFWRQNVLVEEGVESAYTEHWHRDLAPPEAECGGLWLRDAEGVEACLVSAGEGFGYARGRREMIAGGSLAELVAGAQNLKRMQALVDCEISIGRNWRIGRSSLPYRVGIRLVGRMQGEHLLLQEMDAAGQPAARRWQAIEQEGDVSRILDAILGNI